MSMLVRGVLVAAACAAACASSLPDSLPALGEWCQRACQGVTVPACPPACPPPAINLTCPRPRCPAAPPCPACSVACPPAVCPEPVCHAAPAPAAPAAAATAERAEGDGYEVVRGRGAYRVYHAEAAQAWQAARDICAAQGAHLAVPNSQSEAEILKNIIEAYDLSWIHIGIHDLGHEGQFTTVLGEPLRSAGYASWGPGQPNGGRTQNCAFMWGDGLLADGECGTRGAFVCERPFVPRL